MFLATSTECNMNRIPSNADLDQAADRLTDTVIGLGAVSMLMIACVTFLVG